MIKLQTLFLQNDSLEIILLFMDGLSEPGRYFACTI